MSTSRNFEFLARALLTIAVAGTSGCGSDASDGSAVITASLSALHAESDLEEGGRIRDALGREVLLRGVNVNSLGEYYAFDPEIPTVHPFDEDDADAIQSIGWNFVRLILSWSLVEPEPGVYDESYLDEVEAVVRMLESRGIYALIDLHEDAWGPTLEARPDEECPEGTVPAVGWDGAPSWATFDGDRPRCIEDGVIASTRFFSPAVLAAFQTFWDDVEGPGGVGIQTRYHAMLTHVVARFSRHDSVAGYDIMNEPNAWSAVALAILAPNEGLEEMSEELSQFYQRGFAAVREGEERAGAPKRLFFIEPSPDWGVVPEIALRPDFEHDGQVVYAPHIYQGTITETLDESGFQAALEQARMYGGVPVVTGEWGADPARAKDPEDDYFQRHEAFQDQYRFGAALWQWSDACGDPHHAYEGDDPNLWGFYEVECPSNEIIGFDEDFAAVMRRPLLHAAPGRIESVNWDDENRRFTAAGKDATSGQALLLFLPEAVDASAFETTGIRELRVERAIGPGEIWTGQTTAATWEIDITL